MSEDSTLSPETKARLDAAMNAAQDKFFAVASTPAGDLILCSPTRQNYLMYRTLLLSEEAQVKATATGSIFNACACDPDLAGVQKLLARYPGIDAHPAVSRAIQQVCGLAEGAYAKITAARDRFERDSLYAASCWLAFNRGDDSIDALMAGEVHNELVAWQIGFVKAHREKKGK